MSHQYNRITGRFRRSDLDQLVYETSSPWGKFVMRLRQVRLQSWLLLGLALGVATVATIRVF